MQDLNYTDDLNMASGDFLIKESDSQHVQHILKANKGDFKMNPELGVGIENMLNSEEATSFLIEAKKNLEYDGMKVQNIEFTEQETLKINANYTE